MDTRWYYSLFIIITLYNYPIKSYANEIKDISTDNPKNLINEEDSISSYNLEEVRVEASRVIHKADMDVYHPSESAIENASNGMQLLNMMAIPSLFIDDVMDKITAKGENVQIRINGRIATVQQVKNILPASIKRVEWIDNPGLRYNNANCVLNIIVNNPDVGGSLMLNAMPILNEVFGNYNLDLKLNKGRSEWDFSLYFKPTMSKKTHREYQETFTFHDGKTLERNESPLGGKIIDNLGNLYFGYSYIKPDTTIFYITFSDWAVINDLAKFNGKLITNNSLNELILLNQSGNKGQTPKLALYLEHHFKRRQTLVVDFSSSLYLGHSFTDYIESQFLTSDYLVDIHTYIKDLNQAYGIEADYIKEWTNSKFTGGLSYTVNINRSKYLNLGNAIFHQSQNKLYFFGEYFQKLSKFTLTFGIGAQYTDFEFKETKQGNHSWNIRPQASITYSPDPKNQFRINFTSWQITPSLSETNVAPQQTDGFQWNIGNPELKTYNIYNVDIRYAFNFWRIFGNVNVNASTSPKAIAPYLFWENNKLITSYENSKGKQVLAFSLSPQIQIIPNWLTISGDLEYRIEKTEGTGYKLQNRNWNGNFNIFISHWNFTFITQYNKARRTLWGEKISWGEDFSTIALLYDWKNWQFGALIMMPFGKYDQGSKMLSKWNKNEYHLRIDFRMIGLIINYNLQWGKQKNKIQKIIDVDSSVDKSVIKSR